MMMFYVDYYKIKTYDIPLNISQNKRISDGSIENDFYVTNIRTSEQIIMLSQVDQALCDEAANGRIHGNGGFYNGYWVSNDGLYRLNLRLPWNACGGVVPLSYGGLSHIYGQPCIEMAWGKPLYQNITKEWNTQWQYLRMATGVVPAPDALCSIGGFTQDESSFALSLQQKFGLSGVWGGKNRVSEISNWYEDKTLMEYSIDIGWQKELISNSENIPLHSIIRQNNGDTVVVLPETILHYQGFSPRRVFWLSEPIHYPIKRGEGSSGTVYATLSLPVTHLISDDLFLCYPGGANAVDICDLTLIRRAKKVNLLILNKQGVEGWKFVMGFAARLRREHINFTIKLLNGNKCKELSLKQFRKYLHSQDMIVPAELGDDFGGRLNSFLESKHPDLIPGVLRRGEAMLISGIFCPEVAFYLATSVRNGSWDGRWKSLKRCCRGTLFMDKYNLGKLAKTEKQTKVDIFAGNISLADAKQSVKDSGFVIFASQNMQNDKSRYHELIKFCLENDISVIMFTEKADAFMAQVAGRFYELNCRLDSNIMQYTFGAVGTGFGVNFTLTPHGQLASCRDLSEAELNQLCNRQDAMQVANGVECIGNLSQEQIHSTMFVDKML